MPLWVGALASVAYVVLIGVGAILPRLEMYAAILWRGPEGTSEVALTFDDGPHPEHTRTVLRALEEHGAQATFFVVGRKAERFPHIVAEIAKRGHLVAIHGYEHDRLFALRPAARVRRDLARALEVVQAATGARPRLFRPPIGQTNPTIARIAREMGLTLVGWSVRARDGVPTTAEKVVDRVNRQVEPGAIVLLHDAAERDDRIPAAPAALPAILKEMRRRGLTAVRLDAWIDRPQGDSARPSGIDD